MAGTIDMNGNISSFRDWVPIRVDWRSGKPLVEWCYAGSKRFTHPFFGDTIEQMLRRPFSLLFRRQTSLTFLEELSEATPGLAPAGFIFHMSRCGSTLVSQMLAALPQNIVISEAPPLDAVLRSRNGDTDEQRAIRFKDMVNALGRPRSDDERHYFIKFDSWSTLDLELIRRTFPNVPWIFLYRNPIEVIVSQMRQPGMQMIPGVLDSAFSHGDFSEMEPVAPEEYCARVLARICNAALAQVNDPNGLLVNYDQLPHAVAGLLLRHFRVSYSPNEIALMNDATRFHAKAPRLHFEPDRERKLSEASDAARHAAETWLEPLYRQLEATRTRTAK